MNWMAEDEWWDRRMEAQELAETEAMAAAESSADLLEFDSDEEREAYVEEMFSQRYEELLAEYEKAP